ncbi:hypothetical protein G7B40_040440 [Aetokthonos hydrillicola Thurmond2011]|jgi:hypothetical protein|uniref:Uncharacterized protein n=1 Tax=Aetokthonos hydrillicola Thurmond2011 TaxID=2712845 RepID=A0AAP5M870_9CYAN|nr:hypothetical protein [Aetokthonos hydrillicola]MDR9893268.1 hypothetical protein [Aetokthonos hydrillicola Thurmond2011]MDR9900758.1 hypothetical protein [Aetokthonos hydrillicola Thurmond2011]
MNIKQVNAELIKPGDIIYLCGFYYLVKSTQAEQFAYGIRQASVCVWAGIGDEPYHFYKRISHGRKHGLAEFVLREQVESV